MTPKKLFPMFLMTLFVLMSTPADAVPGSLDTTFGFSGKTAFMPISGLDFIGYDVAQQGTKLVAVGLVQDSANTWSMGLVARFQANGQLDTSFANGNGYTRPSKTPNRLLCWRATRSY